MGSSPSDRRRPGHPARGVADRREPQRHHPTDALARGDPLRWVVERTAARLHGFRRLRVRWERRDDIHEAFLGLAICRITHRHVQRLCQDL
ncbi:transposase [Streptomyces sp. NPDC004284]|uniref:transposase n=1 Tax=Streptomyces sp. NPDC004284 TaxID=3364695 RepID=UPI003681A066